ncbi:MAG TPA: FKBP-type peptidyl-prolyl cis-trans isomerase [Myxococcaceae bacterium]
MPPFDLFDAPSLDGLRVTVPGPPTVMKEDVVARIEQLRTDLGQAEELPPGTPVAEGDQVVLDSVGFVGGKVLAFSAVAGQRMTLKPDPELPGYAESLVGMEVGGKRRIQLHLPPTWPEIGRRVSEAEFDVELKSARRITRAAVMDPAFLEKLGGGSLDEVGQRLAQQIAEERLHEAEGRAVQEVVGKLASRVGWVPPAADIDAEIEARWQEAEGDLLEARQLPEGMRREALEAWLTKARLREEVAQQLKEARVLESVAEQEGVEVDPGNLMEEAKPVLAAQGLTAEQAWERMEKDPRFRAQLTEQVRRYKTVELVMSRAKAKVSTSVWGI